MPHDKRGRTLHFGDVVRFKTYGPARYVVGVICELNAGAESCNLRAVAACVLDAQLVPEQAVGLVLSRSFGTLKPAFEPTRLAVLVQSGWLNAHETELVATYDGQPLESRERPRGKLYARDGDVFERIDTPGSAFYAMVNVTAPLRAQLAAIIADAEALPDLSETAAPVASSVESA